MTTKWSGRLLEWGTSENSAETGDSPVFHGTRIWQIVKGLGPQQKASSSGNTNKHIHQPASVSSFSALTCNVWESNDVCRNQHDVLDAPDKQFYSNESWVPGTTGANCNAGNKPIPRNLAMIQAWDDKWMLGSRTSGREWLFYLDTEQKKAFHSMAPIHQGVLLYTAGNISRGPRFTPVIMKYVVPLPNFESWKYIQSV